MSTTTENPARKPQLFLPGQVAAPEGPVDMKMMYVMHHAFRRDLDKFAAAVAATPADDVATWKALGARWDLFFTVLHNHHSGEDAGLWPFLLERADETERATLEAMEEEHSHIDPLLAACAEGFATMAGNHPAVEREDVRNALKVRVVATRDALARHLAHEETDAMTILQKYMTEEQWIALEKEHFQKKKEGVGFLFAVVPWVVEGMDAGVRDALFSDLGGPFRLIWVLTRRGHAKRDRAAFGHLA
ncbi:hemerythrin domain-containing protein [Marmoricola sp. RAF53]|uniref:hemerythrin domain-containing protein n=1 Tax=Marmoricola sp. RAF53 TaxID=3233059 RepID=UPI003F943DA9